MRDDDEVRVVDRTYKAQPAPKGPRTPYAVLHVPEFNRFALFHGSTASDASDPVILGWFRTEQEAEAAVQRLVAQNVQAGKPKPRYKLAVQEEA